MGEDEREDLIFKLLGEFQQSIGSAFNDEKKFSFIAGARAALIATSPPVTGNEKPDPFEQGGISDRLSNFDSYGNRVRERG